MLKVKLPLNCRRFGDNLVMESEGLENNMRKCRRFEHYSAFFAFFAGAMFLLSYPTQASRTIEIGDWTFDEHICTLSYDSWGTSLRIRFSYFTPYEGPGGPIYDIVFDAPFISGAMNNYGVDWLWVKAGNNREPFYYVKSDSLDSGYAIVSGDKFKDDIFFRSGAIPLSMSDALRFMSAISISDSFTFFDKRWNEILSLDIEGSPEAFKIFDVCMNW